MRDENTAHPRFSARARGWASYLTSSPGQALVRSSLAQCEGLNSLYVQHIATDGLLRVVADTATRLTILDISFSREVTDQGLVHLCGPLVGDVYPGEPGDSGPPPRGCRYLRELYFNPHSQSADREIRPQVIACLLRHLHMLQVRNQETSGQSGSTVTMGITLGEIKIAMEVGRAGFGSRQ